MGCLYLLHQYYVIILHKSSPQGDYGILVDTAFCKLIFSIFLFSSSFISSNHTATHPTSLSNSLSGVCTMASKPHPPLMKKHSQTDLISRLKSRKILGVGGEDDDGEVHRSKVRLRHMMFYACNFIQYRQ